MFLLNNHRYSEVGIGTFLSQYSTGNLCRTNSSNISETTGPIKAKFHMEPQCASKKFFSGTKGQNDNHWMTFDFFTKRSNMLPAADELGERYRAVGPLVRVLLEAVCPAKYIWFIFILA